MPKHTKAHQKRLSALDCSIMIFLHYLPWNYLFLPQPPAEATVRRGPVNLSTLSALDLHLMSDDVESSEVETRSVGSTASCSLKSSHSSSMDGMGRGSDSDYQCCTPYLSLTCMFV